MTYTYRGTKVDQEWMPLAMANGVEDGMRGEFPREPLYRRGLVNRALYRLGRWCGRCGVRVG